MRGPQPGVLHRALHCCQLHGSHLGPTVYNAVLCRVLVKRAGPQHNWLAGRLLLAAARDDELRLVFLDSELNQGFLAKKLSTEAAATQWVTVWQEALEPERQALQVRHPCAVQEAQ